MTLENTKKQLLPILNEYAEKFTALDFVAKTRIYYTDKCLNEYDEFSPKCETVWFELSVRCENMEEGDALFYSFFRDVEKGGVNLKESDSDADEETINALEELYSSVSNSDNPTLQFMTEYERSLAEFREHMEIFEKKLKKIKYLSYAAIGIIAIILVTVFIGSLS